MKLMHKLPILCLTLAAALFSCTKPENPDGGKDPEGEVPGDAPAEVTVLKLSPYTLNLTAEASEEIVKVTCDGAWTAAVAGDDTWLRLSVSSGSGDGSFFIIVDENGSGKPRGSKVTVLAGKIERTVNVTQSGKEPDVTIQPSFEISLNETSSIYRIEWESVENATGYEVTASAPDGTVLSTVNLGASVKAYDIHSFPRFAAGAADFYCGPVSLSVRATTPSSQVFSSSNVIEGCHSHYAGGTGTEADPYRISLGHQLALVGSVPDACFVQTCDIDLSDYEIFPCIGAFRGVYDGASFKISNFRRSSAVNVATRDCALFGDVTAGGCLKNIYMEDPVVLGEAKGVNLGASGGINNAAALVGRLLTSEVPGGLVNCHTAGGSVSGNGTRQGGLIGSIPQECSYAMIRDCSNDGTPVIGAGVNAEQTGGLIGLISRNSQNINVINCRNKADVTGYALVGGLAGGVQGKNVVIDGFVNEGTIWCREGSVVEGQNLWIAGGIAGRVCDGGPATMTRCTNRGTIRGSHLMGGLFARVGDAQKHSIVNCCNVGRFEVENFCGEDGDANATAIGGIVGTLTTNKTVAQVNILLSNCFAAAPIILPDGVTMNSRIGGIVAVDNNPTSANRTEPNPEYFRDCYFDSEVMGISCAASEYPGSFVEMARTTAQMKDQATFAGWDFDTVWMMNGYPSLRPLAE